MRRSSKIALVVTGLVVVCVLGVVFALVSLGPALPGIVDCSGPGDPTVGGVVAGAQKIKELFPRLGPVTTAHWQDREAVPRTCPQDIPMRYSTTGVLVPPRSSVDQWLHGYVWEPADPPTVSDALKPYLPATPHWTSSAAFNTAMGGSFELDAASTTLVFTVG